MTSSRRSKSPAPRKSESPVKKAKSRKKVPYVPNPLSVPKNKDCHNHDIFSGDHQIPKNGELTDFLWSMQDEPHASRRKAMIKEIPNMKDLFGHEWRTKYMVVALWCFQMGLAYYVKDLGITSLKFWAIAYCIGAVNTSALFLAIHEISHNGAFAKVNHNKLFGIFTNVPMLVPFFIVFKIYHNEHHKYQGVEGVDTDLPTSFEAKYLSSTLGKFFYMFNQTWFYALRPVFVRAQPFTKWHALNASFIVTTNYLIYYFWGWGAILYLLACNHLAGSLHPIASHFIAEHYTFYGEVETASYYGWLNYFTWNVGYHNEHHDFPNVPWSRLPKLREVGDKYYHELPYHKSWVMALVKFLFDPSVSFYNRVKRTPKTCELLKEEQAVEAKKTK